MVPWYSRSLSTHVLAALWLGVSVRADDVWYGTLMVTRLVGSSTNDCDSFTAKACDLFIELEGYGTTHLYGTTGIYRTTVWDNENRHTWVLSDKIGSFGVDDQVRITATVRFKRTHITVHTHTHTR